VIVTDDGGNDPPGGDWPLSGDWNYPHSGGGNDPQGGNWPPGDDLKDTPSGDGDDPPVSRLSSNSAPEPGTLALIGATLFGLVFARRKR
jgi:hypothetical protein